MKKIIKTLLITLPLLSFFGSCEKDNQEREDFTMTSNTWYRFSPTNPTTVSANGTSYTGFAYVPGGGSGTATNMGTITMFFNQLAYTSNPSAPQPVPDGSVSASVSLVPGFPILGGPLPLIQSADFTPLTTANSWLQMAATDASGRAINSVIYNSSGDAIFTVNTTPSIITPASPTRMNFSGKCVVVGGRGKFATATGEMDFSGFFNPQNPNDAGYNLNGWIEY